MMKEAKGTDEDVQFAKFENLNDKIKGELVESRHSDTYGKIFTLRVKEEDKPYILIGKIDLNKKMNEVPIGCLVEIEYVKDVDIGKGKKMKIFKVLYDDGNSGDDAESETVSTDAPAATSETPTQETPPATSTPVETVKA